MTNDELKACEEAINTMGRLTDGPLCSGRREEHLAELDLACAKYLRARKARRGVLLVYHFSCRDRENRFFAQVQLINDRDHVRTVSSGYYAKEGEVKNIAAGWADFISGKYEIRHVR